LLVCDALSADDNSKQKALLDGIVAMLTKLAQRGDAVSEELEDSGLVSSIPTPIPIPIPTPIAVPNESAGDTQAKNLFRLFLHHHLGRLGEDSAFKRPSSLEIAARGKWRESMDDNDEYSTFGQCLDGYFR
jgi:hypothetical protein